MDLGKNEEGTDSEVVGGRCVHADVDEALERNGERLEDVHVRDDVLSDDLGEQLAGDVDLVGLLLDRGIGERGD